MSATNSECNRSGVLCMAMELSVTKWVLGFSTGVAHDPRVREVAARDVPGLRREIGLACEKFALPSDTCVVSCYEAGREGFWLHRCLTEQGVENVIIDSASIEQNRRCKQLKTDRIDVRKLVRLLCRHQAGEAGVLRCVRVPTIAEEDQRHLHRELKTLLGDRTRVINRLRALLAGWGLNPRVRLDRTFPAWIEAVGLWNGDPLPPGARARLQRQFQRLQQCETEIHALEQARRQWLCTGSTPFVQKVRKLLALKAVGVTGSWLLVGELFGWRTFDNRRQLASLTGLVGAPFRSGQTDHEQGITKAGSRWVRSLLIEIAWMWLRYQPHSRLSQWYWQRFGRGNKRLRKIGIVALARKLIIALWKWVERGIPPEGAILVDWYTKLGLTRDPRVAA